VPRAAVKRLWPQLHVSVDMGLGLLFVLAGLTGSLLVFHRGFDAWLNPAMLMLFHRHSPMWFMSGIGSYGSA
jgi:uncharacterized iron-regulated membrane protein